MADPSGDQAPLRMGLLRRGMAVSGEAGVLTEGRGTRHPQLAQLLSESGARHLLLHRIAVFLALGAALGAAHVAAGRGGSEHVAITALLAALVPVFAPVCFVSAVLTALGSRVTVPALATITVLGWLLAAVHLGVWEGLAAATGSIGGPEVGDVPFMLAVVAITSALASLVYALPGRRRWSQPLTVASLVVLYAGSFLVHAAVLEPSLSTIRHHFTASTAAIEVGGAAAALVAVWALMRREVRSGAEEVRKSLAAR